MADLSSSDVPGLEPSLGLDISELREMDAQQLHTLAIQTLMQKNKSDEFFINLGFRYHRLHPSVRRTKYLILFEPVDGHIECGIDDKTIRESIHAALNVIEQGLLEDARVYMCSASQLLADQDERNEDLDDALSDMALEQAELIAAGEFEKLTVEEREKMISLALDWASTLPWKWSAWTTSQIENGAIQMSPMVPRLYRS